MGCRDTARLTMVCSTGCRGISAPVPEHLLALLLHWPWCPRSCCSHIFSLLYPAANCPFFFLFNCIIPEVLPSSLMGLALASHVSLLEMAGTAFSRHGGSFWQLLTEATPTVPPLPKPCHASPIHLSSLEREGGSEYVLIQQKKKKKYCGSVLEIHKGTSRPRAAVKAAAPVAWRGSSGLVRTPPNTQAPHCQTARTLEGRGKGNLWKGGQPLPYQLFPSSVRQCAWVSSGNRKGSCWSLPELQQSLKTYCDPCRHLVTHANNQTVLYPFHQGCLSVYSSTKDAFMWPQEL